MEITINTVNTLVNKALESQSFTYQGLIISRDNNEDIRWVRIIAPVDERSDTIRELAYELVITLLSETTNNDACDVTIRERSAHLKDHEDLPWHVRIAPFGAYIVVDARIEDELT